MNTATYTADAETLARLRRQAEADFDAGLPGVWTDFYRTLRYAGLRPIDKVAGSMRKANRRGVQVYEPVRREVATRARYSDKALAAIVANGEAAGVGRYREAEILLGVAPEFRPTVVAEAHTFRNATPDAGRWSDALRTCAGRYPRAEVEA